MAVGKKLLSVFFSFTLVMVFFLVRHLRNLRIQARIQPSLAPMHRLPMSPNSRMAELLQSRIQAISRAEWIPVVLSLAGKILGLTSMMNSRKSRNCLLLIIVMASWQFGLMALMILPMSQMFTRPTLTKLKHTLTALTFSQ